MALFQNTTFRNETVDLDGNEFHGCDIQDCLLIYRGGELPVLVNCVIAQCDFAFDESARNTIAFFRAFYRGGFQPVIDEIFHSIRTRGTPPSVETIH